MTVEIFAPAPLYIIQGTGPYAIPHPYTGGAVRVSVVTDREVVELTEGEYTVTPAVSDVAGDISLSPAAAALHSGQRLLIERETRDEQGWMALLGERETGLERQLDRLTMAVQELRRRAQMSLRSISPINTIVPAEGHVLMFSGDAIVSGPLAAEIEGAQQYAQQAAEAAQQAATASGQSAGFAQEAAASVAAVGDIAAEASASADRAEAAVAAIRAGEVRPADFGIRGDGSNETTAITQMLDWTSLHGIPVRWTPGIYALTQYDCPHDAPIVDWRTDGPVTIHSLKTAPNGTGYEDDFFIRFSGKTIRTDSVSVNLVAGAARPTIGSTAGIVAGDLIILQSTRMIETDHRGQARHGVVLPVARVSNSTVIETERSLPFDCDIGDITGSVTSVSSATRLVVSGLTSRRRSQVRYRIRFTSGAASGQTANIIDFDRDTHTIISHDTNARFPSGVAAGNTFVIERQCSAVISKAARVRISGDFTLARAPHLNAAAGDQGFRGLWINRADRPLIEGVRTRNFSETGIRLQACYAPVMRNQTHYNCNRAYDEFDGTGYGVSIFQSSYGVFSNIAGISCRRTLDIGGTQAASYDNFCQNISGHGGGTTYTGLRFWPVGTERCTVVGSHGAAFGTRYVDSFGEDTYGIVNCRGDMEQVRGVLGIGRINQMVNCFYGGALDVDGLYYRSRSFDWGIPASDRLQPSRTDDKLFCAVRIAAETIIPTRAHTIRNVNLLGVAQCIVSIEGAGTIGPLTLTGYRAVTDNENGSSTTFRVIQNTGAGAVTLGGNVWIEGHVENNPASPKAVIYAMDFPQFTMTSGHYVRLPGGQYVVAVADDASIELPTTRDIGMARVSIYGRTDRNWRLLDALVRAGIAGNHAPVPNAAGIDILGTALTGTTGTDGNVSVAFNPAGTARLHIENRTGAAQTIQVECSAII